MTHTIPGTLPKRFLDLAVIYPSEEEKGKWVAHSILTDQIGVGDCVLEAFVELRRAIKALLEAAQQDADIQVFRLAPDNVRQRLLNAAKLPDEIIEIADMQLAGRFDVKLAKPWKPRARTLSAAIPVYA
jgi:hypothetical protein